MQDFRKLKMWEKAHQLTLAVYRVTVKFPKDETYGLISQIRRLEERSVHEVRRVDHANI